MTFSAVTKLVHRAREQTEPMTPWEFACKWVPRAGRGLQPDDWGFKAEASRHISEAIGGTPVPETIRKNWGDDFSDCPHWVPLMLKKEDALRDIAERINRDRAGYDNMPSPSP